MYYIHKIYIWFKNLWNTMVPFIESAMFVTQQIPTITIDSVIYVNSSDDKHSGG